MKKVFEAKITCKVKSEHPDIEHIKNPNVALTFDDTYTMDTDYFNNEEEMINHIKNDLSIVAGGGYNSEHIYDAEYSVNKIREIWGKI